MGECVEGRKQDKEERRAGQRWTGAKERRWRAGRKGQWIQKGEKERSGGKGEEGEEACNPVVWNGGAAMTGVGAVIRVA